MSKSYQIPKRTRTLNLSVFPSPFNVKTELQKPN